MHEKNSIFSISVFSARKQTNLMILNPVFSISRKGFYFIFTNQAEKRNTNVAKCCILHAAGVKAQKNHFDSYIQWFE